MKISESDAQPPQNFVVNTGANDSINPRLRQENTNPYSFSPQFIQENMNPFFPWILPSDSQEARFQFHLNYSCYCVSSRGNNGIDNQACLFCEYRSRRLAPPHPEVTRLRDPEDASRCPMFRYYDQQLTIRDHGLGASYCPIDVVPHFVRRSRRWRVTL